MDKVEEAYTSFKAQMDQSLGRMKLGNENLLTRNRDNCAQMHMKNQNISTCWSSEDEDFLLQN